jgi:hypothetical protein
MKEKKDISVVWANENRVHFNGTHFCFDHDWQIPGILLGIDTMLHKVANSRGDQFKLGRDWRGRPVVKFSKLATELAANARSFSTHLAREYLPRHTFSPYFEAWERRHWDLLQLRDLVGHPEAVEKLNHWFDGLRRELRESPFRMAVSKQQRAANKNAQALRAFFNALFRKYSHVLVVRVDFGYRNKTAACPDGNDPPTDAAVKVHLKKMLRHARRKVPNLIGIVWKLEYGAIKGHHVHAMFLLDGNEVREGVTWGKLIGEEWLKITDGTGSYFNANSREDKFQAMGRRGVGMISYFDKELRENLMRVGDYMAKSSVYARFISPAIGRTFAKSKCVEAKGARGRPRKYVDPVEGIDLTEQVKKIA